MSEINNENYLEKLFINEAKPALKRHSGGSGGSESVVGGWVFNEVIDFSLLAGHTGGGTYHAILNFKTEGLYIADGVVEFKEMAISTNGGRISYYNKDDKIILEDVCGYGEWVYPQSRVIVITEQPTDPVFIEWLKANAVRVDESLIGTWVFNEELTHAIFGATVTYECDGIVDNLIWSRNNSYMELSYQHESAVYDDGWPNETVRTIKIIVPPTDATFISWLKANAVKIDDSLIGTWVFNETINLPSKAFEVSFADGNGGTYLAIEPNDVILYYSWEVGDETDPVYDGGEEIWIEDSYKTITISKPSADPEFVTWLKANATKIS